MPRNTKTKTTLILLLVITAGGILLLREPETLPRETPSERSEGVTEVPHESFPADNRANPSAGQSNAPLRLHFSNAYNNDVSIGKADRLNIDRQIGAFIARSRKTLDAALFELESDAIARELIKAAHRGVRVRLVLEDDYASNGEVQLLQAAGIPIVTDQRSAFMHNKFLVADGRRVWTGSVNATDNGAWRNNNNGLEIESRKIAENYSAEFREMFEQNLFGPRSPSNTPHTLVKLGPIDIYNYFAPEDDVQAKILRFLRLARYQIRFMAFSFTDDTIGSLLVDRFRDGLDVAGVLETRGSSIESSELGRFRSAGLPVLTDANRYAMHHKVIVVDSLWTILGSYNFTASANERNDENIVIVKDQQLALTMLREYDRVASMKKRIEN